MAEPMGQRALSGQVAFAWVARPLSRPIRSVGYLQPEGEFDIALFRLDVRILRNRTLLKTFSTEQIGWRRTVS
jgi:hypothetical protein